MNFFFKNQGDNCYLADNSDRSWTMCSKLPIFLQIFIFFIFFFLSVMCRGFLKDSIMRFDFLPQNLKMDNFTLSTKAFWMVRGKFSKHMFPISITWKEWMSQSVSLDLCSGGSLQSGASICSFNMALNCPACFLWTLFSTFTTYIKALICYRNVLQMET